MVCFVASVGVVLFLVLLFGFTVLSLSGGIYG